MHLPLFMSAQQPDSVLDSFCRGAAGHFFQHVRGLVSVGHHHDPALHVSDDGFPELDVEFGVLLEIAGALDLGEVRFHLVEGSAHFLDLRLHVRHVVRWHPVLMRIRGCMAEGGGVGGSCGEAGACVHAVAASSNNRIHLAIFMIFCFGLAQPRQADRPLAVISITARLL